MNAQVTSTEQQLQRVHPKTRRAFTLVELLVVITIIGILVALLIPAVSGVMGNARNAQMGIEISSLAQAMEKYKLEMGTYPPDFALASDQDLVQLNLHLARKFRSRVMQGRMTDNLAKMKDPVSQILQDPSQLDPSEALVFWLSGTTGDARYPLTGADPATHKPTAGGVRVKGSDPFFAFDEARLDDRDGDGFPEYYPQTSEMPYVYLSSQNYGVQQGQVFTATAHPILNGAIAVRAYASELAGSGVGRFVEPKKYQILCAGQDNEFGAGLALSEGNTATYPDGIGYAAADEDNLTNFSEGQTLRAAIP